MSLACEQAPKWTHKVGPGGGKIGARARSAGKKELGERKFFCSPHTPLWNLLESLAFSTTRRSRQNPGAYRYINNEMKYNNTSLISAFVFGRRLGNIDRILKQWLLMVHKERARNPILRKDVQLCGKTTLSHGSHKTGKLHPDALNGIRKLWNFQTRGPLSFNSLPRRRLRGRLTFFCAAVALHSLCAFFKMIGKEIFFSKAKFE